MIPYADFGQIAREEGIEIIGTHDDFDMMVNDFEQALENHRFLGTTNMKQILLLTTKTLLKFMMIMQEKLLTQNTLMKNR